MDYEFINQLELENTNRRAFLKKSFFGLTILTTASSLTSSCATYPEISKPLKVLNNKEFLVFNAIAQVFINSSETGLPDPEKIGLIYDLDKYIFTLSSEYQKKIKTLLNVFEDYTFFFNGSMKKFTKMSFEEKKSYLEAWSNSTNTFKEKSYNTLKMLIMTFFYNKKETLVSIGYSSNNHCN